MRHLLTVLCLCLSALALGAPAPLPKRGEPAPSPVGTWYNGDRPYVTLYSDCSCVIYALPDRGVSGVWGRMEIDGEDVIYCRAEGDGTYGWVFSTRDGLLRPKCYSWHDGGRLRKHPTDGGGE